MIYTNDRGEPIAVTPRREDYETDHDYVVAVHECNRTVSAYASKEFDKAFRLAMGRKFR